MHRPPTDMELRVAKALFDHKITTLHPSERDQFLAYGPGDYELGFARAAIRAMREPTKEMISGELASWGTEDRPYVHDNDNLLREDWQAMIDTASPPDTP